MISAEAPALLAKACEIFILELTMRSWYHTEENKRRTLQRSDVAMAIGKSEMYDFLIDIVPRDETRAGRRGPGMMNMFPVQGMGTVVPGMMGQEMQQQQQQGGDFQGYYLPYGVGQAPGTPRVGGAPEMFYPQTVCLA
jgi:hypothetical protein